MEAEEVIVPGPEAEDEVPVPCQLRADGMLSCPMDAVNFNAPAAGDGHFLRNLLLALAAAGLAALALLGR